MYMTSKKTVQTLGVSAVTLRRWSKLGKIQFIRTDAGQRLYNVTEYIERQKNTLQDKVVNKVGTKRDKNKTSE